MSELAIFVVVEFALAIVFAQRSRFVQRRRTLSLWAAHLGLSLFILGFPDSGVWLPLMTRPVAAGRMLTVAAATLALLLFTANFFHGAAKPEKDAETYFGVVLDTYLSQRSWFTNLLLAPTFHAMVMALFALPVALPSMEHWSSEIVDESIAAWLAALGLVFTVLLLNALVVLRVSLMRLVRRHAIRRLIRDEEHASFLQEFRALTRGQARAQPEEVIGQRMSAMVAVACDQQIAYFNATVAHLDVDKDVEKRLRVARHLVSVQNRGRILYLALGELLRGNREGPEAQAKRIAQKIDWVECARAAALARAQSEFDDDVRERVLGHMTMMAGNLGKSWERLRGSGLEKEWLGPPRALERSARLHVATWGGTREPEVLRTPLAILERVIDLRLPRDGRSVCTSEVVLHLARQIQVIEHAETRKVLIGHLATRLVDCTVVHRSDDESLDPDWGRSLFKLDHGSQDKDDDFQTALRWAAFRACLQDETTEGGREELLRYLNRTHQLASLIHVMMYRFRGHRTVDASLLRPYVRIIDREYSYTSAVDLDREELYRLSRASIDHFFFPADVDWLVASLEQNVDRELIDKHLLRRKETYCWMPIEAMLLWRGTVKDIQYCWGDRVTPPAHLSEYDHLPYQPILDTARILNEIEPGRGDRLLSNNMWASMQRAK